MGGACQAAADNQRGKAIDQAALKATSSRAKIEAGVAVKRALAKR